MRYAELVERFGGMAHRLPIGLASHDDADERPIFNHLALSRLDPVDESRLV
jgi:hypothetical protein